MKKARKKVQKKTQEKPPTTKGIPTESANRLHFFVDRRDAITETIRQLVEVESPSDNKQAVDELGTLLAGRFEALGGHSKFHRTQDFGDHLQVDFVSERSGKPVLLLCSNNYLGLADHPRVREAAAQLRAGGSAVTTTRPLSQSFSTARSSGSKRIDVAEMSTVEK